MSDEELAEKQLRALIEQGPAVSKPQPTAKAVYSHETLVQLIVDNPTWTHKQYAEYFGRTPSWFSAIIATDGFQAVLDPRRHEISDPSITATLEERFRGLMIRSMTVLQTKLESAVVKDETATKVMELGIKGLGLGQKDDEKPKTIGGVAALAQKLMELAPDVPRGPSLAVEQRKAPTAEIIDAEMKELPSDDD